MALWGLAGTPALARSTSRCQHVFLNGRPIRDRTLQHALREAYRGLIDPARYPTAVLLLEMDPAMVDVNVHPQKTEVRFRDSSLVHSVVLRAVRDALRRADLTPLAGTALAGRPAGDLPGSGIDPLPARGAPPGHVEAEALASFFRGLTPGRARLQDLEPPGAATEAARHDGAPGVSPATSLPAAGPDGTDGARGPTVAAVPGQGELGGPPTPTGRLLQVHNSYVVTQDEQGIVIVDQHALHERAMFEYLLARVSRGPLESQPLLVPVVIPATPAQAARLAELAPLLGRLGIAVEPVGPAAVAVQAFPTLLTERGVEPESLVSGLIERAEADGLAPGTEAALHEVLDMMACKAAIKAGAHLSERELSALLELRQSVERSSNCPHGRPTSIRLTLRELDKRFGRS
ncbi:MAG TPA: hypothetical protein VD963_09050 [Phycisphaerales bacterium]|nr:hypothetical protein [Phycisphaerales bacterium]